MKTAPSVPLRDRVRDLMPRIRADLETLVRIPSISHPGHEPSQLRRSAEATAKILSDAGAEARLLEIEGAPPAVLGRVTAPAGSPTVLLHAHHDVPPTGAPELWHPEPLEPNGNEG